MKGFFFITGFVCGLLHAYAQETQTPQDTPARYKEDQFYVAIAYNVLLEKPTDVSQTNFSNGIQVGFIKDIPFSPKGNTALGIGIGYALNSYYSNLRASKMGGDVVYEPIAPDVSYKRNKLETHLVEMPVEFRWRTATAQTYKFWRIYTGVKFGYVFANASKYIESQDKDKFSNPDIQPFQYGLYLSLGYNTWNFYANYQLRPLFKEGTETLTGEAIQMKPLQVGLIFYIL